MTLTSRQRTFLERLLDLYRESHQPIHYSTVAEKLGIGRTTAYDMMRLLEQKGYVTAEYILAAEAGPGRSTVVFYPTPKAHAAIRWLSRQSPEGEEWEQVRERILSRLGQGTLADSPLLEEVLARLAEQESPLSFCAEALTGLLLNLQQELRSRLNESALIRSLIDPESEQPAGLTMLPGVLLGLGLTERANRQLDEWIRVAQAYQQRLQRLAPEGRQALLGFLREMVAALEAS